MKKPALLLISFIALLIISCTKSENNAPAIPAEVKNELPGKTTFTKNCRLCHGNDGTLGLSGAANLKISVLNLEEIKTVVTNGRKGMPAWGEKLTSEQIQQVAEYVITLRN